MMLAEHCDKAGEKKKADYWKSAALDVARAAGDEELINLLMKRK
jgi:hypothetical protein